MLSAVFQTMASQSLIQSLIVDLIVDGAYMTFARGSHQLVVCFDQICDKLAKENGAAVSENSSVLLRAMSHDRQIRIRDNTTFKHNGSRLIHWEGLVTQASVKVCDSSIVIHHGFFTLAGDNLIDETSEGCIQFFRQFLLEGFKVCLCDLH